MDDCWFLFHGEVQYIFRGELILISQPPFSNSIITIFCISVWSNLNAVPYLQSLITLFIILFVGLIVRPSVHLSDFHILL